MNSLKMDSLNEIADWLRERDGFLLQGKPCRYRSVENTFKPYAHFGIFASPDDL